MQTNVEAAEVARACSYLPSVEEMKGLMKTSIPRLVLAPSSPQAEAISEASIAHLIDHGGEQPSIGRFRLRLRTDEQLARELQCGNADALTELFRTAATTQETVRVVRHNLYRGLERLRRIVAEGQRPANDRKGDSQ